MVTVCDAGPLEAGTADADAVADRLAVAEHVVEAALVRRDHDGARRVAAVEDHDLRGESARPAPGIVLSVAVERLAGQRIDFDESRSRRRESDEGAGKPDTGQRVCVP